MTNVNISDAYWSRFTDISEVPSIPPAFEEDEEDPYRYHCPDPPPPSPVTPEEPLHVGILYRLYLSWYTITMNWIS